MEELNEEVLMEAELDYPVLNERIKSPKDILTFLDQEFSEIDRVLAKYNQLLHTIDLSVIKQGMIKEFEHQVVKSPDHVATRRPSRLRSVIRGNPVSVNEMSDDTRKQWKVFKSKYLKWAKNVIAHLNKAKKFNKFNWLSVEKFAKHLIALKLDDK